MPKSLLLVHRGRCCRRQRCRALRRSCILSCLPASAAPAGLLFLPPCDAASCAPCDFPATLVAGSPGCCLPLSLSLPVLSLLPTCSPAVFARPRLLPVSFGPSSLSLEKFVPPQASALGAVPPLTDAADAPLAATTPTPLRAATLKCDLLVRGCTRGDVQSNVLLKLVEGCKRGFDLTYGATTGSLAEQALYTPWSQHFCSGPW